MSRSLVGSSRIEDVRGFEHEVGDQDAGLLAAREVADGGIKFGGVEEEFLGPAGDVDGLALEIDGVADGAEGFAEFLGGVEGFAVLGEVDDAQVRGGLDGAGVGLEASAVFESFGDRPGDEAQEGGLARAVGAQQAQALAGGEGEVEVFEEELAAQGFADAVEGEQAFGFAVGGLEVDGGGLLGGVVAFAQGGELGASVGGVGDLGFVAGLPALDPLLQPGGIAADFARQRVLLLGLGVEEIIFAAKKFGVVALGLEGAAGVGAGEFDDAGGGGLKKGAVVGDEDHGDGGGLINETIRARARPRGRGGWWARRA